MGFPGFTVSAGAEALAHGHNCLVAASGFSLLPRLPVLVLRCIQLVGLVV
jgi:hypothetical protein